jgi:hypothetical protein
MAKLSILFFYIFGSAPGILESGSLNTEALNYTRCVPNYSGMIKYLGKEAAERGCVNIKYNLEAFIHSSHLNPILSSLNGFVSMAGGKTDTLRHRHRHSTAWGFEDGTAKISY